MKARIVIALAFVTVGLLGLAACGGDDSGTTTSAGPPPPPPTPPPPRRLHRHRRRPCSKPEVTTVRIVVRSGRCEEESSARPSSREKVAIVVGSDVADHVHLHGYDKFADVAPGKPARLAFVASIPAASRSSSRIAGSRSPTSKFAREPSLCGALRAGRARCASRTRDAAAHGIGGIRTSRCPAGSSSSAARRYSSSRSSRSARCGRSRSSRSGQVGRCPKGSSASCSRRTSASSSAAYRWRSSSLSGRRPPSARSARARTSRRRSSTSSSGWARSC